MNVLDRWNRMQWMYWVLVIAMMASALTWETVSAESSRAVAANEAQPATPLYENLGNHHHAITTTAPLAQRYFDQGLRLVYAFNHAEAIQAFQEAARLDPNAAMAYWGIAYALGPNINAPMEKAQAEQAYEAIQQAQAASSHASPRERAYITALATRYSRDPQDDRKMLDRRYADAMRELAKADPSDLDAVTLYAEAMMDLRPWDFWTHEGKPKPGTKDIVGALERVLKQAPDHIGACHYYIHAVEASPQPERALPCAERLPQLIPGAGHLVHMPAHIYLRLGQYDKAAERNMHAAAVDHAYIEDRKPTGIYPMGYYPHNVHFLWAARMMEGRSADAIKAARDLAAIFSPDTARQVPVFEFFVPSYLLGLVRFGKWEEILHQPAFPEELQYSNGIRHYARGLALVATGRLSEAGEELTKLDGIAQAMPGDRMINHNSGAVLLKIARFVLAGELAAKHRKTDEAVRHLREAIELQDGLNYIEPPDWYYPVRQSLGAVLLSAGRYAEAETVYREDLKRNPENGWSLYGLAQSLRVQKKADEAAQIETRFKRAWAHADVTLTSSRF